MIDQKNLSFFFLKYPTIFKKFHNLPPFLPIFTENETMILGTSCGSCNINVFSFPFFSAEKRGQVNIQRTRRRNKNKKIYIAHFFEYVSRVNIFWLLSGTLFFCLLFLDLLFPFFLAIFSFFSLFWIFSLHKNITPWEKKKYFKKRRKKIVPASLCVTMVAYLRAYADSS